MKLHNPDWIDHAIEVFAFLVLAAVCLTPPVLICVLTIGPLMSR
jgi:hypothetical protein